MPSEGMVALKNLKLIVFTGIGVANFVDLNVAKNQGITVCNTPGYADQTVAEHTIALMLSSARKINKLDSSMKGGYWKTDCSVPRTVTTNTRRRLMTSMLTFHLRAFMKLWKRAGSPASPSDLSAYTTPIASAARSNETRPKS